jgi:acetyl esterase
MKLPCVALLAFALLTPVWAADTRVPLGEPHVYKRIDGRELRLHVLRPADWKASDQRPGIVFFHGGGWTGGAPNQFNEHSAYFSSRGLVCVQVEYRLLKGDAKAAPTVCIQDARSAMRWVRSHAKELGLDPNRIASGGGSAGGHLAAHVGMVEGTDDPQDDQSVSAKSNAMLLYNPVLDNGPGGWGTARVGERYPEFSPAHNVTRDDPPAVIFLGSKDALIPVTTLEKFARRMKDVGVRAELHVYDGQGHGFFNHGKDGNRYYTLTVIETDKFLNALGWLRGAPTLVAPVEMVKP